MLHNARKLLALTVFELLSFKFYQKGGAFQKSTKLTNIFFGLINIYDNSKINIHTKFKFDISFTSGSMTSRIFEWGLNFKILFHNFFETI